MPSPGLGCSITCSALSETSFAPWVQSGKEAAQQDAAESQGTGQGFLDPYLGKQFETTLTNSYQGPTAGVGFPEM